MRLSVVGFWAVGDAQQARRSTLRHHRQEASLFCRPKDPDIIINP